MTNHLRKAPQPRQWSVDLWRNGVVTIRPITGKKYEGASLQMCTANSKSEAECLRIWACKLAYDNKRYILPEFSGTLDGAAQARAMFIGLRDRRRQRKEGL